MEISCPACAKTSDLRAATVCPRCGCDLGPLALILAGAAWHLRAAAGQMRARDWRAALEHAQQSWSLCRSRHAARAACLAAAALGETRAALTWRLRGQD
jgi:transcription initiation factor TFIIIB Brf1 subunit/transcription initiation factor TFIIB